MLASSRQERVGKEACSTSVSKSSVSDRFVVTYYRSINVSHLNVKS